MTDSTESVTAVSRQRHQGKCWIKPTNFSFAKNEIAIKIDGLELSKAALSLPTAFIQSGDSYELVALMGLTPGLNLLVDGTGKWVGRFAPAAYRNYPFLTAKSSDGGWVLCVDESTGLVLDKDQSSSTETVFDFYDDNGLATEELTLVKDTLTRTRALRDRTSKICQTLQQYGLIRPWNIALVTDESPDKDDEGQRIEGLYCIDNDALDRLEANKLAELRDIGGLAVAYPQLLSMSHISEFIKVAAKKLHQSHSEELALDSFDQGGNIDFSSI